MIGPTREFGEHKIHHYWTVELEDQQIEVKAGGYFWRPSTGGDSFISFRWVACPGSPTDWQDLVPTLGIVDDAKPFGTEIDELDLDEPGYSINVTQDGEDVGDARDDEDDEDDEGEADEAEDQDTVDDDASEHEQSLKPDYGLMLAKSGYGGVKQFYYSVPLAHLCVSGPGLFTSMLNTVHDGVEYAVSFDFGPKEAAALLAKASPSERKRLEAEIRAARPGDTLEFNEPIVVDIETRLGEVQSGTGEKFTPLVVVRVT